MRWRFAKRLFAGVMLITIASAVAMPLPAHERATSADCHQAAFPAALVPVHGSPAPACDHGPGTSCATMVGCLAVPSALTPSRDRLTSLPVLGTPAPVAATRLHGRLTLGPPTPPPNT